MKTTNYLIALAVSGAMLTSCGGSDHAATEGAENHETAAAPAGESMSFKIDNKVSNVRWEGNTAGVQVYGHFGDIKLKDGSLQVSGKQITGGEIVIDMNSINPMDENYSAEHPASDLVGHLMSPDFFDVANHPTATFKIKSVNGTEVIGDLTIRGITHEEKATIEHFDIMPDGNANGDGSLVFDRQKYDVKWAHYLQDVILEDNIKLNFHIHATKS